MGGGHGRRSRAAVTGDDPAVRLLLAHGAALNRKFRDGGTALAMAVIGNHISTVRLLLSYGATVNARTLKEAAAHRDHIILKMLRTRAKKECPGSLGATQDTL